MAAQHGHIDCLKVLVEIVPHTLTHDDDHQMLLIEYTIKNSHLHCLEYLIEEHLKFDRQISAAAALAQLQGVNFEGSWLGKILRCCAQNGNLEVGMCARDL